MTENYKKLAAPHSSNCHECSTVPYHSIIKWLQNKTEKKQLTVLELMSCLMITAFDFSVSDSF